MKTAIIEKIEIRDWTKSHILVGTFTGKIHWLTDCENCLVEVGNIQFAVKPLKRYATKNLCVDETVGGKPYCLFFR